MSVDNMDKIFRPGSIAVVGASERKGSVGAALMHNLIARGFPGEIHPINPNHKNIYKLPACPSIKDLKAPVDLAVIATPIASAPQIVHECADAGVGGVVIISAGGKEIGKNGQQLEAAIKKEAAQSGLRIIGPNCLGIVSSRAKLNASFASQMPLAGKMAFLSQSGAICSAILDLSIQENIGFSHFVSLGSMLDVGFGDMIDYLGGQPEVSSIVMYVESLARFRNFMSAARAVSRGEIIRKNDIDWLQVSPSQVQGSVLADAQDLIGKSARRPLRAGMAVRTGDVQEPVLVGKNTLVTLVASTSSLTLTIAKRCSGICQALRP